MSEQIKPAIIQTRAKPDERLALMGLNAIWESFDKNTKVLAKRLETDPFAMRNLKTAKKYVENAIKVATDTITTESLAYINENSKGFEISVQPRFAGVRPSWLRCLRSDLAIVVEAALQGECATCMLDPTAAGKCALRKAMENIADAPKSAYGCEFRGKSLKKREETP